MPSQTMLRCLTAAGLFAMTMGCAVMKPPAKNGGPTLSEKGIQIAVLGQSCSQTPEPDEYGWDLVHETVEIGVSNGSTEAATVRRDRFRLLTPDGGALRAITCNAAEPLQVAGGADERFRLRFMARGGLECGKEMRLDPDSGVTVREQPIAFQPVSFVPLRDL